MSKQVGFLPQQLSTNQQPTASTSAIMTALVNDLERFLSTPPFWNTFDPLGSEYLLVLQSENKNSNHILLF
jgi:hypothetical protein